MEKKRHIVIVGGGIIGSTTAYYLTRHPKYDPSYISITLIEGTGIASAASGKAGGLLALDWHGKETSSLAKLSYELHEKLAKEYDGENIWGYRKLDTLQIVSSVSSKRVNTLPKELKWIDAEKVSDVSVLGTTSTTAQVHPYHFTKTIFSLAQEKGVKLILGTVLPLKHANTVSYIPKGESFEQTIHADSIVIAAGPWTGRLCPEIPISGCRAHSIVVTVDSPLSPHALFTHIKLKNGKFVSPEIYARKDEVLYICGETDSSTLPPTSENVQMNHASCDALKAWADELSVSIKNGIVKTKQACYLPVCTSYFSGPFIGKVKEGLYVGAGHGCWGICNGPGTGKVLSEILLDGMSTSIDDECMSAYEHSTQATVWTFTVESLKALRETVISKAKERIQNNLDQQDISSISFLNVYEEWILVGYYAMQIEKLGSYFEFSSHIKATAVMYLKRFYLLYSVMDYHPKLIMLTCLFLATKVCDHYISLDQFVRSIPKVTSSIILEHEFLVCRALSWDFYVWHAYRPLYGFILDMQTVLPEQSVHTLGRLHGEAKALISRTLWADLQFLYSPSYIALGCLMVVDKEIIRTYIQKKGMDMFFEKIEIVSKDVVSCSKIVIDMEEVKGIDKRLFYCSDLVKKKDALLYAKRKAQEEVEQPSLERVGRICWLRLTPETVHLVVVPDYTGTQVWAILEVKSIFEDYHVQSNTNDIINLEIPIDNLHKALKSSVNALEIVLRLTKQDHFPMLSCSISLLGKSGGISAVTHNIHVRVLSPLMQLSEPVVPEPDCHIILPPLSQLRYISERFRVISNKIILKANMSGEFQIGVVSDSCKIETKFKDLINPELDPNTVEDISKHPSQIRDKKEFVTMKVDARDWLNLLQAHISHCMFLRRTCFVLILNKLEIVIRFFILDTINQINIIGFIDF
ncbi:hypothetical protein PORY_001657 [Pneumocystis oryctolagi]|uniref:Uncharacterized protein n=1 Tax=Pneumocystis oryctolagi TaxID=42067 RepID=A0ACB7CB72_9ASCO|nr:hypothetical protein PORY_001657 [Pneumocystis oryctolagi]